jgi:D-3-phosphoglycerate dehydrogenase
LYFHDSSGLDPELSKSINAELFAQHQQVNRVEDADIILAHITPLVVDKDYKASYILCPCTNVNHITIKNDAQIISLKDCKNEIGDVMATVYHTFYLIFNIIWQQSFKKNTFMQFKRPVNPRKSLKGMKLGIIGLGRIGKNVERIAHTLGMICHWIDKDFETCTKHELLTQSDIITLHTSIEKDQKPILGEEEFSLIKDGTYLINTSRGAAIDEKALLKHIDRLGGFACDVLQGEPNPKILETLLAKDNTFITPHIGGFTYDDLRQTFIICYKKLNEGIALGYQSNL